MLQIDCSPHGPPPSYERPFWRRCGGNWDIENSLHWVLDTNLKEDQSRVRPDHGPQNPAVVRHLALNLVQLYGDADAWMRKVILNVAGSGRFPSDRTIAEYTERHLVCETVSATSVRQEGAIGIRGCGA